MRESWPQPCDHYRHFQHGEQQKTLAAESRAPVFAADCGGFPRGQREH